MSIDSKRRRQGGLAGRSRSRRALLALCISAALHAPVWAQETTAEAEAEKAKEAESEEVTTLDAIEVTGIRASLIRAQDMKRDADTHIDAISAVDISALPDVSVLEALQRIPGISIERFAAKDDPDHFSTEGSGVTLRGLPNTRSEFNGRDTFSANSGRGLSFQDVPPELIGSVEVFKNQTADMVEGGISGTINLNTRKPLDSGSRLLQFTGQANYGDLASEVTPSFSGLFSNVWDVGGGRFGLLASLSHSDLDFRSDGAQFGAHVEQGQGSGLYAPINAGIRTTSTNRKRDGASLALQYQNADRTFDITGEYVRSDSDSKWVEYAFFSDDAGGTPGPGSVYDSQGRFVSGTLQGVASGLGPQTRGSDGNTLLEDYSVTMNFRPTDRLTLKAELQYVESTTDIVDLSVFGALANQAGGPSGVNIDLVRRGGAPRIDFRAPTGSSQTDAAYFTDPNNYFWRAAMDHIEESEGDALAFRFDADYALDGDFFRGVETGFRTSERDQTTRWSTYNWGNLSEAWTGNGLASFAGGPTSTGFSLNQAGPFGFRSFHNGNVGGLPGGIGLFPNPGLVTNYNTFRQSFDVPGVLRGSLSGRPGADGFYLPAEINGTNEQNDALYVRLNFENDAERRFGGNIGLRYVRLDTRVDGGITFPTLNLPPNVLATLPPDVVAFANGASSSEAARSSYDTFLPSLNLKYELAPDMLLRFGASKAVALPDLGNLRYNYNISADITTVNDVATLNRFFQSSGNPFLKPMESNNFDLSLEYYFDESDFVALGFFYKDIKNFFSNNTVETPVTNNGVTQIVDIDQPINIGEASISGFEFSYQQFFDELPGIWGGLGVQFNYTYLNPSDVPQQNLRPVQSGSQDDANRAAIPFDNLPLQGLSKNQFNLVGIFQNDKWEARLAYNWRDDYLLTIREVNIGLPTFAKDYGQLDGSLFYRINDTWQLGLQGSNLLQDEVITENQVNPDGLRVFRSSFIFDTRYTFVIRGTF
ncbi:TonB-dependent receptor [Arenimonas sp. MALMAid1274]|uniref:TonB-dependent receptor n=1 Tax=Arenimonas sp. MALMAid1274 TaxID=3411630 RepID=UPI003B9F37CB